MNDNQAFDLGPPPAYDEIYGDQQPVQEVHPRNSSELFPAQPPARESQPTSPPAYYSEHAEHVYQNLPDAQATVSVPSQTTNGTPTEPPESYLPMAICTSICCFFPFGIVAVVFSIMVLSAMKQRSNAAARYYSKLSKRWITVSIICGLCVWAPALCFVIYLFFTPLR